MAPIKGLEPVALAKVMAQAGVMVQVAAVVLVVAFLVAAEAMVALIAVAVGLVAVGHSSPRIRQRTMSDFQGLDRCSGAM